MSPQDSMGGNFNLCDCGLSPTTGKYRIARVKFGVPLQEVFKNDIPGPLLVLILKLNKEGPYKKDVFRAPGHQGNMKKLIHFLQNGRLVNIDNFSVYTIASVLKKFLRKLPDGIFGREGEQQLFQIMDMTSIDEQRGHIHSIISSLPLSTQRLIVLLFGTFRAIASNCDRSQTGMTSEALGVSVAPSFFQSCVSDGKQAKMEDVLRFKAEIDVATKIMKFLIDNFGVSNLFGRENYEYYARITGRILKVEEDWIFSFRYPPDGIVSTMSHQEESQSTPALMQTTDRLEPEEGEPCSSLTIIPENNLLESYTRLSISLEDNGLFKDMMEESSRSSNNLHMTLDELRAVNHYAESTKSLTFLPQVHERQAARMAARSEWFLSPSPAAKAPLLDAEKEASLSQYYILREESMTNRTGPGSLFSSSAESLKQLVRRSSSKEKERRLIRRSSSKKNKENGASSSKAKATSSPSSQPQQPSSPCLNPSDSGVDGASGSIPIPIPDPLPSCSGSNQGPIMDTVPAQSLESHESRDVPSQSPDPEKVQTPKKSPTVVPQPAAASAGPLNLELEDAELTVRETDCTETAVQTFHVTLTYKPRI